MFFCPYAVKLETQTNIQGKIGRDDFSPKHAPCMHPIISSFYFTETHIRYRKIHQKCKKFSLRYFTDILYYSYYFYLSHHIKTCGRYGHKTKDIVLSLALTDLTIVAQRQQEFRELACLCLCMYRSHFRKTNHLPTNFERLSLFIDIHRGRKR